MLALSLAKSTDFIPSLFILCEAAIITPRCNNIDISLVSMYPTNHEGSRKVISWESWKPIIWGIEYSKSNYTYHPQPGNRIVVGVQAAQHLLIGGDHPISVETGLGEPELTSTLLFLGSYPVVTQGISRGWPYPSPISASWVNSERSRSRPGRSLGTWSRMDSAPDVERMRGRSKFPIITPTPSRSLPHSASTQPPSLTPSSLSRHRLVRVEGCCRGPINRATEHFCRRDAKDKNLKTSMRNVNFKSRVQANGQHHTSHIKRDNLYFAQTEN